MFTKILENNYFSIRLNHSILLVTVFVALLNYIYYRSFTSISVYHVDDVYFFMCFWLHLTRITFECLQLSGSLFNRSRLICFDFTFMHIFLDKFAFIFLCVFLCIRLMLLRIFFSSVFLVCNCSPNGRSISFVSTVSMGILIPFYFFTFVIIHGIYLISLCVCDAESVSLAISA